VEGFKAAHISYGKPDAVIVSLVDVGNNVFDHIFMLEDLEVSGYDTIFKPFFG
jgi:hypothetical protein